MKVCTQCQKKLPLDAFYGQIQHSIISDKSWTYKDSMCKSCRSNYTAERRRSRKREAVKYLGGKCLDCGLVDSVEVYDFHHRNPKGKDFSIGKNAKSFEKIKAELDKCDLLCSNCHRKRHASGL